MWTGSTLLVGWASSGEPGGETLGFLAWGWLGPASSSEMGDLRLDEAARLGGICRQRKRFGTAKSRKSRWLTKVNGKGSINDRVARDSKHDRTDQFEPLSDLSHSPNFNLEQSKLPIPPIPPGNFHISDI